jgi:hypothetical protein
LYKIFPEAELLPRKLPSFGDFFYFIYTLDRRAEADEPGEPGREEEEGRAQRRILPHGQVTPVTRPKPSAARFWNYRFVRQLTSAATATC